jgi:hypothetical protein
MHDVLKVADCGIDALAVLLAPYGLTVRLTVAGESIAGSYWGESEAGLLGSDLHVRLDTPVHSALHEACHFICMDPVRRLQLNRDAGGDCHEENAVCYLQILLADKLPGFDRAHMQADMDAWGYTFRLGSARAWFDHDADDARNWLQHAGIIDPREAITRRIRTATAACA